MTSDIEKIWTSERLVYRGIRKEDHDFFSSAMEQDPANVCLAAPLILAPPRRQSVDDWWKIFGGGPNTLLAIVISLQRSSHPAATDAPCDTSSAGAAAAAAAAAGVHGTDARSTAPAPATATTATATTSPTTWVETPIGIGNLEYGGYGASPHSRSATLGITLAKPYQNHGYGTEVVRWMLDWGFRHANLHSIHLGSVEYNKRAHRCYEKCGFTRDGRRRQCFWHDGKYWDLYFFSLVEDEWADLQRKKGKKGKEEEGKEKEEW